MHPNPRFRETDPDTALSFAAQIGFGMLVVPSAGLVASHIPFVLNDNRARLDLHLVRSNPIARMLKRNGDQTQALLAVQGPHAYISPDWYGIEDQVPTWNYVAVHLKGKLIALEQAALVESVKRLSAHFEAMLEAETGKKPWTLDKMSQPSLDGMLTAIRPFRFEIQAVDSTFKLGQNKQPSALTGAVEELATSKIGSNVAQLASLMQNQITQTSE